MYHCDCSSSLWLGWYRVCLCVRVCVCVCTTVIAVAHCGWAGKGCAYVYVCVCVYHCNCSRSSPWLVIVQEVQITFSSAQKVAGTVCV